MITQDDIESVASPPQLRLTKVDAGIAQFLIRSGYEEGYRAAGGDGRSKMHPDKGAWFDHWITSTTRAMLVANGIITGQEGYK